MNLVRRNTSSLSYDKQMEIIAKEKQYRANDALNYSSIKDFDEHGPLEFYKRYIAKEREAKKETEALDMGNLVDCLLTVPDTFDNRFFIYTPNDSVKGQNKELVEEMFKIAKSAYNQDTDQIDMGFEEMFRSAFESVQLDKNTGEQVKFKGKTWESILSTFQDGPMENYFQELLANVNKRGVSKTQVDMAEAIVNSILSVPVIHNVYNRMDVELHNQFPLYFEYKGFKMKGLIDTLHINHEEKWIQEFDLKTSWSTLNFSYNRVANRYYLQEAVYNKGLSLIYPDYTIRPRKYIIADSKNHIRPYLAATTQEHLAQGFNGFKTVGGRVYKGLDELLDEMQWHFENSIWNTTMNIHRNSDEIVLDLFGE